MRKQFAVSLFILSAVMSFSAVAYGQESKSRVITAEEVLRVSRGTGRTYVPTPAPAPTDEVATSRRSQAEAERDWSERLRAAQTRVRELRRLADAAELEINRLKNLLFSGEPRSSQTHKGLIADIDVLTYEMRRLRAEAATAQAAVEALLSEGAARGFSVTPTETRNAISNRDEFRSRYNELNIDLLDAERRADVLQLRANDIHRRILLNSGTGDEFYNTRLRDQLTDTEEELYDTRARIAGFRRQIDAVRRQARSAGVILN